MNCMAHRTSKVVSALAAGGGNLEDHSGPGVNARGSHKSFGIPL
jgi:hypothetical protein